MRPCRIPVDAMFRVCAAGLTIIREFEARDHPSTYITSRKKIQDLPDQTHPRCDACKSIVGRSAVPQASTRFEKSKKLSRRHGDHGVIGWIPPFHDAIHDDAVDLGLFPLRVLRVSVRYSLDSNQPATDTAVGSSRGIRAALEGRLPRRPSVSWTNRILHCQFARPSDTLLTSTR